MGIGEALDEALDELETSIGIVKTDLTDSLAKHVQTFERVNAIYADRFALLEARLAKLEAPPQPAPPKLGLGAVTYYYPGPKWDTVLKHKPRVVVINPASGPGTAFVRAYEDQVGAAALLGVRALGYVATGYGKRPKADILAEIDRYSSWYGVTSIFFDQGANTDAYLPFYTELCKYVQMRGLVCINPGTRTTEGYAQIADWLMVAETDAKTYVAQHSWSRPAWELNYPGKLWHAIHTCSAASMPAVVAKARTAGAGLIWVTDDVMNNPYDSNPSYLDALAAELAK